MWEKINGVFYRDRRLAWGVSLVLLAIIAGCECATGVDSGFGVFYLLPVVLVAWYVGKRPGMLMSGLAAASWTLAAAGLGPGKFPVAIWDAIAGLCIYTAFVLALTKLKASLVKERELLRVKGDLLSVVSHEFNNALTSMGMALLILRENDENPDQRRKVYPILERVYSILKVAVRNFLNQGRMESGRFHLDVKQIELRHILQDILLLMRPLSEQKELDLLLELPKHPIPIVADPDALSLVMSNLIGNAIKYTHKKGRVTIRLAPLDSAEEVEVSVEDTGIGISPQDQEAIFQGYFRTQEGKKAAKGFGFGLKIAREIVESHGSTLKVHSAAGQGARFYFRLPACQVDCPYVESGICHRCRRRNPQALDTNLSNLVQ